MCKIMRRMQVYDTVHETAGSMCSMIQVQELPDLRLEHRHIVPKARPSMFIASSGAHDSRRSTCG